MNAEKVAWRQISLYHYRQRKGSTDHDTDPLKRYHFFRAEKDRVEYIKKTNLIPDRWRPAFVIGVPVGFVNVEAAKELILESDVPYIVNRGRKGGSNVAAAICNALLYELTR